MLASLIIVFREVLEAGLIIGIVLAATEGVAGRGLWIGIGVGAGVAGSGVVALFADQIYGAFGGNGQEIFNASVLLIAVAMLTYHTIWMSEHGRQMAANMKAIGRRVASGDRPPYELAIVVGGAVMREGSEVVLFLAGVAMSDTGGATAMAFGAAAGIALAMVASVALYWGLVRIPTRWLFAVTTGLITLLAAGLAAQAVAYLSQAGLVPFGGATLWDSSWLLRDDGLLGRTLHVLIGYTDRPSEVQVAVYISIVMLILGLTRSRRPDRTSA